MGIRKISTRLPNGGGGSRDWNIRQDCRREDSKELCSEFAIHIANSVQGTLLELHGALGLSGTRLPSGFFKEIRADTCDPFSSLLSAPCSCPGPMQDSAGIFGGCRPFDNSAVALQQGMTEPRHGLGAGWERSLAQHRREVVEETVSQRRGLDAYSYTRYHPMEEIYQWMIQISEKYAEVVTQHFLGMTYETRPMYYLKISQPSNNPKKIIWMDCGIHAREWIAPAFCQWFVKEILQNYKDDSRIKKLLRNLDFYVLPVLNIDGYIYTWTTDRLWRKSRSSHNNGTCFGTDLNRNFNVSWCSIGASRNCQDITFCGTGPVSEPETKAVSSLIESKKDNIVCFLTMHSFGQLILTPYGYTKNKSSNHEELIQVGQKAANALKEKHGTNYRVGSSADILYATSGSSRDWARDMGIPFSYTFELRDNGTYGFVLPEAQIQATCEESMAAILSVLDDVYEKYWGVDSAGKAASSAAVVLGLLFSFMSLL
ncbi:carboxypeptidase O [Prionailurus bengalensis]|uniref:carboxypeptidase O n=1 Tax=Prionailurus bengalensis TaxID=37029 RepID=UPI001CA85EAA|nr:carboxypeptidase O [Prionailurus bengalensis]